MSFTPDLDAYFQRLGDSGSRAPTLETLQRVQAAHARAIPFENIDILLGRAISVEPEAIEQKLVHDERGGYCFEQNGLLLMVLQALGFEAQPISARVSSTGSREIIPYRTHLFLRVEIDGESWLADVGVGALTPVAPLRLQLNTEQPNSHETRRIISDGIWNGFDSHAPDARLFHQARMGDEWTDVCDFTLESMHPRDRELANWFTSTHPNSRFRQRLSVARVTERGRVTLLNDEFKQRGLDGVAAKRTLTNAAELLECLKEEFGLRLPAGTRFDCVSF